MCFLIPNSLRKTSETSHKPDFKLILVHQNLKMFKLEVVIVIIGFLSQVEGTTMKVWAIPGRPASLDCRSPKDTCLWRRPGTRFNLLHFVTFVHSLHTD